MQSYSTLEIIQIVSQHKLVGKLTLSSPKTAIAERDTESERRWEEKLTCFRNMGESSSFVKCILVTEICLFVCNKEYYLNHHIDHAQLDLER